MNYNIIFTIKINDIPIQFYLNVKVNNVILKEVHKNNYGIVYSLDVVIALFVHN